MKKKEDPGSQIAMKLKDFMDIAEGTHLDKAMDETLALLYARKFEVLACNFNPLQTNMNLRTTYKISLINKWYPKE
jgi:hypothetical protein